MQGRAPRKSGGAGSLWGAVGRQRRSRITFQCNFDMTSLLAALIMPALSQSRRIMEQEFQYDVFLSHSAKDKAVVRPLAERLRKDGLKVWFDEWVLKPGDSIPAKIDPPSLRSYGGIGEGLEHSRVLACPAVASGRRRMLYLSAHAFGSDWAQLEMTCRIPPKAGPCTASYDYCD